MPNGICGKNVCRGGGKQLNEPVWIAGQLDPATITGCTCRRRRALHRSRAFPEYRQPYGEAARRDHRGIRNRRYETEVCAARVLVGTFVLFAFTIVLNRASVFRAPERILTPALTWWRKLGLWQ